MVVRRIKPILIDCGRLHGRDLVLRPNTSKLTPGHRIYPYLLRGLTIDRPNHVWATDITYTPMARGFCLSRRRDGLVHATHPGLATAMEATFCIDAVEQAIAQYDCPQIFNTDQGSQFTSAEFIKVLTDNGISISIGRQGRLARQRLRRALLANGQVRGSLSACL